MQPGEGNKLDEANYGTECHSTCRTHTVQLCTQPGSHTDLAKIHTITPRHVQARTTETQKKTHTQTHTSIHTENSKMFALRGQEITCVCSRSETCNTWQFFLCWMGECLLAQVRAWFCVLTSVCVGLYVATIWPEQPTSLGWGFPLHHVLVSAAD